MRRRITVLFALVSALGLVGMTVFAVQADDAPWRDRVDSDLQTWTGDIAVGCPPVTLFTAGGGHVSRVVSRCRPCLAVPAQSLQEAAAEGSQ